MNQNPPRCLLVLVFSWIGVALCAPVAGQSVPPAMFSGMKWRSIGPFRGGRVVAVCGIPGDPVTYFFGSAGGGVWKTPNAGVTWEPLFDGQPIASIGALAVAPSNPLVIYAGTGESDIRSDLSSGDGVYRSSDGGKTWSNVGLKDSRQISRIVVDPKNADVVYVGALGHAYGPNPERGVYKSADGGKTWTHVLDQGPEVGVSDLAIASGNTAILFAATWHVHRPPWSTYAPLEGGSGGLFRSTNSGATWTRLKSNGLPDGDWRRAGVSVSPDGRRVYALIDAEKKSGLYRSDNGGDDWTLANADPRLTSRGWYFNQPTIDPNNPDVVYVPNVALYRLDEAGKLLRIVRGAPGGDDYHQLWIDPQNSSRMVLGTDQGTSVSVDRGATWSSWFNQPIGQFYHVTTDNKFPYAVYGAQQDSGSAGVLSRTDHGYITPMDWFLVGGGESGWIVVDPVDQNILFATGVYGSVVRFDRRTSLSQDVTPWPLSNFGSEINARKYRAPWTPMLNMSPIEKNALFLGTQYVMKTTDGGLHWQKISDDLTGADPNLAQQKTTTPATFENARQRGFGVVYSIAASPLKAPVIWAGSDTGLIHLTTDGGNTWSDVTPKGLSDWSKIAMIEASHFDPAVAYAAVDRHRLDDQAPYLYRTRDYGKTWQPITAGIGAASFLNAVREDPGQGGLLFAGTELGVYVSFDEGDHWQPLQLNLPATSVRDLTIHGDDLVIATHGRAFWILDNIMPLRQLAATPLSEKPLLFQLATAVRVDNDLFLGSPFPPDEPIVKNPPDGAVLDYYLPARAAAVKLEVLDAKGTLVRRYVSGEEKKAEKQPPLPIAERWLPRRVELPSSAGMHRFYWDLRWSSSGTSEEFEEEGFGAPRGPKVAPGTYQVRLTVDGTEFTQPLHVQMDPRSQATAAVLEDQQTLGLEVYAEVRRSRLALAEIKKVKESLAMLKDRVKNRPQLKAKADKLEADIDAIENGRKDMPGSGLDAASKGLQSGLRVVEGGDRTTPQQAIEVYRVSDEEAKARIAEWTSLKAGELPEFDRALQEAGLGHVALFEPGGSAASQLSD